MSLISPIHHVRYNKPNLRIDKPQAYEKLLTIHLNSWNKENTYCQNLKEKILASRPSDKLSIEEQHRIRTNNQRLTTQFIAAKQKGPEALAQFIAEHKKQA